MSQRGEIQATDPSALGQLLARAVAARADWAATPVEARAAVLTRAAALIAEARPQFVRLLAAEVGKPPLEAGAEVDASVRMLNFFAGWPLWGKTAQVGVVSGLPEGRVLLKPKGVAGLITPWNYPLSSPVQKTAAALTTGNVVVWRPSPLCPHSSALYAQILVRAGLPEGVISTVHETGSDLARRLVADPRVDAVSFTGSTHVGRQIRTVVLERYGSIQCEMGGKNAAVVLHDADLQLAAERIAYGAFGFAGQKCTALSRVYVERGVRDAFLALLSKAAGKLAFGPADHPETVVGPVISAEKKRELCGVIEAARARGIRAVTVEPRRVGEGRDDALVEPAIFDDVPQDDALMRDEFFGPILAVAPVDDLHEAIARVNDTEYGLAACIFTADRAKARQFAAAADVGTVKINDSTPGLSIGLPAGGWKASGAGAGELGDESIRFFTRATSVIG